jgi:hypothetical protein
MTNFTTLSNRGHRRYIDTYMKKRKFGRCDGCEKPVLLLEYCDPDNRDAKMLLCEHCYTELLDHEDEE